MVMDELVAVVAGGLQDFSVSPSPLGTNWGLELGWAWGVWD